MALERPRVPRPEDRLPMVGWFDPGPLFLTGLQVLVSSLFGRHSDYRLIEAMAAAGADDVFDYTALPDGSQRRELWLDYLADTGDGWDSTYAVAYWLTRPRLQALGTDGQPTDTRPGEVLVFGGDEVYPTAGREAYERRLVAPFRCARAWSEPPEPDVFAIPGNHDWYDSLVSFSRLFLSGRWFQGWRTRQRRSYFALRLPHGIWLLGVDVQLGSDLDALQVAYFKKVAAQMNPGDRVVLATAEPRWVYASVYEGIDPAYSENNLEYLEHVFARHGAQVVVYLAGDLHHYRRHASANGVQKITCGGGGAFLHPTHGPDVSQLSGGFELARSFPDPAVSRRLTRRNLLFPFLNPRFVPFIGSAYAVLGWWAQQGGLGRVLGPAAMLGAFVLFTDTHDRWYRRVAGTLHGATHVLCAAWLMSVATTLARSLGLGSALAVELVTALLLLAGGGVLGSWILGIYLWISLDVFGRHSNEAFSALRIPDWKSFLRLHVDERGDLTIHPIGIERVPRRWKADPDADRGEARLVPDDPRATPAASIEPAIVVPAPRTSSPGPASTASE
jgi:hypothetical protein